MSEQERGDELSEAIDLEANQGFATALEILGEANRAAHDDEKKIVEFRPADSGNGIEILDITNHVQELENERTE